MQFTGTLVITLLPSALRLGQDGTQRHLNAHDILTRLIADGFAVVALTPHEIVASMRVEQLVPLTPYSGSEIPVVGHAYVADGQPIDWRDFRREKNEDSRPLFPSTATIKFR